MRLRAWVGSPKFNLSLRKAGLPSPFSALKHAWLVSQISTGNWDERRKSWKMRTREPPRTKWIYKLALVFKRNPREERAIMNKTEEKWGDSEKKGGGGYSQRSGSTFSLTFKKIGFSADNAERWKPSQQDVRYWRKDIDISRVTERSSCLCTSSIDISLSLSLSLNFPLRMSDRGMRMRECAFSKDAFSREANVRTHTRAREAFVSHFIYLYFYFRDKLSSPAFRQRRLPSSRFPSYCVSPRVSLAIRAALVKAPTRCDRVSVWGIPQKNAWALAER